MALLTPGPIPPLRGGANGIEVAAVASFIGGGQSNAVLRLADHCAIGGGWSNIVGTNSGSSVIGGGAGNTISNSSAYAVISGGNDNQIRFSSEDSAINGGQNNVIQANAGWSFIGGGQSNTTFSGWSVIGGGQNNDVGSGTLGSTIGGGFNNTNTGDYATVPGGYLNVAAGYSSFAAGENAVARDNHSFVWSDGSQPSGFSSTGSRTFNVLASGGTWISHNCSVCSLTIRGGCDLAEPFQISAQAEQEIAEGSVLVIDAQNPGHLKLSDQPYDTCVAGVVSGANGVNPGIQMQQQGLLEGGRTWRLLAAFTSRRTPPTAPSSRVIC